jgi:hypothetical protein
MGVAMPEILEFPRGAIVFDPEIIKIVAQALDDAWDKIEKSGSGFATLGRLQIIKGRDGTAQSLQIVTLSQDSWGRKDLFKTIKAMTQAGRSMMTAERTLSRKRQSKKGT